MFSEELKNISWDETTERIARMTDADVRRALAKNHLEVSDFMALLSPAAEPYLETMARLSRHYTEERFGRTMSMFIPLYMPAQTPASIAASTERTRWHAPSSLPNR